MPLGSTLIRFAGISAAVAFALSLRTNASAAVSRPPSPQPTASAIPEIAPTTPATAPKKPAGFSYGGTLRAYYFVRQNAQQNAANPNRTSFLPGALLHAEYAVPGTGLRVATTYVSADPFGVNGSNPQKSPRIDNSVPGFALSTFDEAYVAFTNAYFDASIGDRVYNFPWITSSDTRIKPASYQGFDVNGKPLRHLTIGLSRIVKFEARSASAFTSNTLLTSYVAGANAPPVIRNTAGALHLYAYYDTPSVKVRAEDYTFYDIANLAYADGQYFFAPHAKLAPFIAAQFVEEHETGRAILGRIANDTIGAQIGASVSKQVALTFGFDHAPEHDADVAAKSAAAAARGIFLVSGGTGSTALLRPGVYRTVYGGIASPYNDGYTSNPLYTTSISQSMIERRSPGTSFKLAATFVTPNRRFKAIASEAYYRYDDYVSQNRTFEDDVDVQYFFNPVPRTGTYHGLSIRERYANRDQPTIPDDFKYLRTQLEYDF